MQQTDCQTGVTGTADRGIQLHVSVTLWGNCQLKADDPLKKGCKIRYYTTKCTKPTNLDSNIKIEQTLSYTIFWYLVKYDNNQISNTIYHKFQIIKVILQVR